MDVLAAAAEVLAEASREQYRPATGRKRARPGPRPRPMVSWEKLRQDPSGWKALVADHVGSAVATTPTKGLPMTTSLLRGGAGVP